MRFGVALVWLALALGPAQAQTETEAEARKARSIAMLEAADVRVLPSLPVIETEATSLRRAEAEVAERMIALAIVAVKGETADHAMGLSLIEQFGAAEFLTPDEAAFMADPEPSDFDRIQFSWRYEGVWMLLWALSLIDDPGPPSDIADVPRLAELLRDLGTEGVMAKARLRPQPELLDAADLIYRMHWAVRQAELDGQPPPPGLDPGVVLERHYTLNWLIGYSGQAWDDISTDT
ncbi:MAG: DUF4272 domain-containing protein [Tabrizicola sp.]|nr:DUF4272 domain-containing protein [Tabrizicola sp.]